MSETAPSKQIRPKVRSKTASKLQDAENPKSSAARLDADTQVEETRQRMENWMGLKGSSNNDTTSLKASGASVNDDRDTSSSSGTPASQQGLQDEDNTSSVAASGPPAKSILKTPKYTKRPKINSSSPPHTSKVSPESEPSEDPNASVEPQQNAICKNVVVERDPTQPMLKRKVKTRPPSAQSHSAVEGYIPSTASMPPPAAAAAAATAAVHFEETPTSHPQNPASNENADTSPLVLNSLEEMFEAAGEALPPQHDPNKITEDTKLLEADIAFSVMTQDQYDGKLSELKEQHEQERQDQLKVFLGTDDIFEGEHVSQEGELSDEDDDDNDMLEMLMGGDEENADDYYFDDDGHQDGQEFERKPRAFRLLWDTLSEWITPEAMQYLSFLEETTKESNSGQQNWTCPAIERSDVESSRGAGLMAMVKLYLPKSLEELGFPSELRRTADIRLGELLRTFNYVQEAPKLPVKLWKAMTCILLEIVMVEHGAKDDAGTKKTALPPSVATVEMTMDEYRYLTHSVVKTFGMPP
jgi:hypothetical protein